MATGRWRPTPMRRKQPLARSCCELAPALRSGREFSANPLPATASARKVKLPTTKAHLAEATSAMAELFSYQPQGRPDAVRTSSTSPYNRPPAPVAQLDRASVYET